MRPRLIVIGGGYVGTAVARALERELDVTLIEPREAFVHSPAMIRALVRPELLERALPSYDRLLRRGRLLRARAHSIRKDGVELAGGEVIPGDLVLVATGSRHAGFLKPQGDGIAGFRALQADTVARIRDARHIAIAGAGPVGIELAGEIAAARPGVRLSLISASPGLMPGFPPGLGARLQSRLAAAGVALIHGRADLAQEDQAMAGPLRLQDGQALEADLVLPATGSWGCGDLLAALPGMQMTARGRVRTDPWLRPGGHPWLFAGGDVADAGDAMTIVATMRQIPFLIRALRVAARGGDVGGLRPYRPWARPPILLPLGPRRGASFLPLPGLPGPLGVVGDLLTRQLKGADLFIPKYRRSLGLGRG